MKCRGCGKEILFIRTATGKNMPVDLPGTPIRLNEGSGQYLVRTGAFVRGTPCEDGRENAIGYTSHFSTCPNADYFRRR